MSRSPEKFNAARAVTYRLGRSRPGTTRLWTIQPLHVWEKLCRGQSLYADFLEDDEDFRDAYDWMRGEMADRLPHYEGHYPWWAYDYRLNLRTCRSHVGPGTYVRIGLGVSNKRVLLSAYGAWHYVLNGWYLPDGHADNWESKEDAWDEELEHHHLSQCHPEALPEPWQSRLTESWRRIFDVEELRATNTIQACFERLDLADVFEVTRFSAVIRGS